MSLESETSHFDETIEAFKEFAKKIKKYLMNCGHIRMKIQNLIQRISQTCGFILCKSY